MSFRERLIAGEPIIGTFIKTPSPIVMEVLGLTDLEVMCLDAEHAPFGRLETDACVSVLRLCNKASLVRVPEGNATEIRNALDAGATGVLVPHVTSAEYARSIVRSAQFGEGGRGYAGSTRAAEFTTKPMPNHLEDSAREVTVIAQIEDLAALDELDEIASVEGIDCLFIGRIDLAVAMGEKPNSEKVLDVVRDICAAGARHGKSVGMFTPNVAEVGEWRSLGANLFLLGSEQAFILKGARELVEQFQGQL